MVSEDRGAWSMPRLRPPASPETAQLRDPGKSQSLSPNFHPGPGSPPETLPNSRSNASPQTRARPSRASIPLTACAFPPRPLPVPSGRGWLAVPYLATLLVAQFCALHVAVRPRPSPARRTTVPAVLGRPRGPGPGNLGAGRGGRNSRQQYQCARRLSICNQSEGCSPPKHSLGDLSGSGQ